MSAVGVKMSFILRVSQRPSETNDLGKDLRLWAEDESTEHRFSLKDVLDIF